jgi:hypothetical protein
MSYLRQQMYPKPREKGRLRWNNGGHIGPVGVEARKWKTRVELTAAPGKCSA